ncbi:Ras-related protein Rab-6 [Symbiodinium microadriaticum]|uniref:Ras-related protein Rab-6 n=1 Tax=Symbiodinium microadriaticum TaxID=2951 RepID=A0A1Q9D4V6_SYMMI|nr:Ras-related protein Rab-6 [Symbiodinium microadriaticum]
MSLPKYKVVLVGDQSVGKTAVVVRYLKNTFEEKAEATIGMDFQTKTVQLLSGSQIRLQLWDTAGQERFRSLVNGYIRDAAAAVVCYDVTNRQSFDSTTQWIEEVRQSRGDDVLVYLVGNKVDLAESRQVSRAEGEAKAAEVKGRFAETSARSGDNVQELFKQLGEALAQRGDVGGTAASQVKEKLQLGGQEQVDKKNKACANMLPRIRRSFAEAALLGDLP